MTLAWADLPKSEQSELRRLFARHRDIVKLGAGALEAQREREALQQRRQQWVADNNLACFKCGGTIREWAAGGRRNGRAWVICTDCVRKPR